MVAFMLFNHHCLNIKSLTSTEQELYSQSYQDETAFYEMSCCPSLTLTHSHTLSHTTSRVLNYCRDKALTSMPVRNILTFSPFHNHHNHFSGLKMDHVSSTVESVGVGHIPVIRSTTHQPIRKYIQLHVIQSANSTAVSR